MYVALKNAKIKSKYEGKTYVLQEGFEFKNESYERQSNGKGDMVNRGSKKVLPIKYTPDFVSDLFIIECKGRANESFPIRWKMFKNYVKDNLKHVILYKPQNQKECDEVIKLITKKSKK
jgi:YHS domain-containing protein